MSTDIAQRAIAANIVKCIFSLLSLAASSTIVHMIRFSPRGLKSPYSRIIFGLSIGDIIQSLGVFLGVFAVPKDTPESPMGGTLATVFYLLFLIYFFWRRVKQKPPKVCIWRREISSYSLLGVGFCVWYRNCCAESSQSNTIRIDVRCNIETFWMWSR